MPRAALLLLVSAFRCSPPAARSPTQPPRVFDVKAPRGSRPAEFPRRGHDARRGRGTGRCAAATSPGVFELVSGEAVVAGWAYPRDEPLPETAAQLEGAKEPAARARSRSATPTTAFERAVVREVAGAPAIDVARRAGALDASRLRTRSVHVFEGDVEYVIEAIAPPRDYDVVDARRADAAAATRSSSTGEVAEDAG